jgi:3-hydroxybutyryl-CoA dehydrogenase
LRIQLLADEPYFDSFSHYLTGIAGIELVAHNGDVVLDLRFLDPAKKLAEAPSGKTIITNTLTHSTTSVQAAMGKDSMVIGLPVFPHYFERQKTIEYSYPVGADKNESAITDFLSLLGKTGEQINDAIAGVFPRALAMIVNEAAFAVQEGVAVPEDIDTAMKLGTNYPKGPLAWCDEIGAEAIVATLDALAREYGADRYRVAAILRRYAEAGSKFLA